MVVWKIDAVILLLLGWSCITLAGIAPLPDYPNLDNDHLYPYGLNAGDDPLPVSDDNMGVASSIGPLKFCEDIYERVWVNPNGILTFNTSTPTFTPVFFPWDPYNPSVAPYWADVDIANSHNIGFIFYRKDINPLILIRATNDVHTAFPTYDTFTAEWIFVASWHEVTFFGYNGPTSQPPPLVTFQVVLIGDSTGEHSFARFAYGTDMEWTTGEASGGDPLTGLGGNAAHVGYDSTDADKFYNHPEGLTPIIHNAVRNSVVMHKLHCNGNGGGTNDPHFIVSSPSSEEFFCFDYGGLEDDVLELVSDKHSDIEVKGSLFAVSQARPDVTYFKEITIKARDATITLDRTDIYLNDENISWDISESIIHGDITLRPLKQRDETIEVSLKDGSVSLVINRHHDQIGYFLGVYLSKTKGLSSHTKGILGRFVHHDFEVDRENSLVKLKLAEGEITVPVVEKERFSPFAHGAVKCWLYAPKDEENVLFKL